MGENPERYTPARMSYDLRRLRLYGIIAKIPHIHRYEVTEEGMRVCLFLVKVHNRGPGFSQLFDGHPKASNRPLATTMRQLDRAMDQHIAETPNLPLGNSAHLRSMPRCRSRCSSWRPLPCSSMGFNHLATVPVRLAAARSSFQRHPPFELRFLLPFPSRLDNFQSPFDAL